MADNFFSLISRSRAGGSSFRASFTESAVRICLSTRPAVPEAGSVAADTVNPPIAAAHPTLFNSFCKTALLE